MPKGKRLIWPLNWKTRTLSQELNPGCLMTSSPTEKYSHQITTYLDITDHELRTAVFSQQKKESLIATDATKLETDCELKWVKAQAKGSKTILVGAFYRSQISYLAYMQQLKMITACQKHQKMSILYYQVTLTSYPLNGKNQPLLQKDDTNKSLCQ